MKIEKFVLEVKIINDRIVVVHKATFIKAIGIPENPNGFQVHEPSSEEFQSFLSQIGYNGEFKEKEFKQ